MKRLKQGFVADVSGRAVTLHVTDLRIELVQVFVAQSAQGNIPGTNHGNLLRMGISPAVGLAGDNYWITWNGWVRPPK